MARRIAKWALLSAAAMTLSALVAIVCFVGRPILALQQDAGIPLLGDALSDHIKNAVVAAEDPRFYDRFNIGITHTTITQSLAAQLLAHSPRRHFDLQAQRLALSLWLAFRFSKDEILEAYLNAAYFGSGAYGIEAAARQYFDKAARDLSLGETAMLAGMLKSPSAYAPERYPDRARNRAASVLKAMVAAGYITAEEAERALGGM